MPSGAFSRGLCLDRPGEPTRVALCSSLRRKKDKWTAHLDSVVVQTRPQRQVSRATMFLDITDHVLMEQEQNRPAWRKNLYLQEEKSRPRTTLMRSLGKSPALHGPSSTIVRRVGAPRIRPYSSPVNETGTGKELIARAIHSSSRRKGQTTYQDQLRCLAPRAWSRASCFGHERKAPSPAPHRPAESGRFEACAGRPPSSWTRIGDIPAEAQAKLLRVLQEREFDRVGGSSPIKVDVRILACHQQGLAQGGPCEDIP